MQRPILLTAALVVALALAGPTQDPPSDYYAASFYLTTPHCCSGSALSRVTTNGQVIATLSSSVGRGWFAQTRPIIDHTNRFVVSGSLFSMSEYDVLTSALVRTAGVPWLTGASRHHADGYTIASSGTLMHLDSNFVLTTMGTVSTATIVTLHGRELWTGDYVLTDEMGRVLLVSHDTRQVRTLTTILAPGFTSVPSVLQSHVDGDLRVLQSQAPGIVRFDPRTGFRTQLSAQRFSGSAVFETTMGNGAIRVIGNALPPAVQPAFHTVTPGGTIIASTLLATSPGGWGMCRADGRRLSARRVSTPNRWDIRVDSPLDAGLPYVVALSATGFTPGIRVGARTLALVPDALFALSIRGALGPLLTGNIGVLPATGVANATLDLRRFGNALSGLRIWTAAAIFDPAAPNGVRRITRPEILVLD